jgi:hypothetical protein
MSSTPPKKGEAETEVVQSPQEEPDQPMDTQGQDQGHEVEVKEQDRWLPIANGKSFKSALPSRAYLRGAVTGGLLLPIQPRLASPLPYQICAWPVPTAAVQQKRSACSSNGRHVVFISTLLI